MPDPPAARRPRAPRARDLLAKRVHHLLGPRLATRANLCLLAALAAQSLVVLILALAVVAKTRAVAALAARAARAAPDARFARPPRRFALRPEVAVEADRYDDMSAAVTGFDRPAKYTAFLGRFLTCKPRPCNIDHWAYLGDKCFYRPKHVKDKHGHNASVWALVQDGWHYSPEHDFACPVAVCRRQWAHELNLTRQIVLRAMQHHFKNGTPWDVHHMFTGNKYVRVNPFFGLEYALHGSLTVTRNASAAAATGARAEPQNRTASITIRRGFTNKYCDVSVHTDIPPAHAPVYVVVPYAGRLEQLRLFYRNVKALVDAGANVRVVVAAHGGPVHVLGASELVRDLRLGFTEGLLTEGHTVQVVEAPGDASTGKFSRSVALLAGTQFVPAEAIVFFCDVDMVIKPRFFDNCRHNAIRGHQAYYPVVYSLFPYGTSVSKEHGYWRKGAYGMVCMYKSDFVSTKIWANDFVQKHMTGWGFEDVLLYKELANGWKVSIFQAIEPNLLHRWHPKHCEFNLHVGACIGTVLDNMGSQRFLASIVAAAGTDVRKVDYKPQPVIFSDFKNDSLGANGRTYDMPAKEGETTATKLAEMRQMYEERIRSGKAGVFSVFAKEARDAMHVTNSQGLEAHEREVALAEQPLGGEKSGPRSDGEQERTEPRPPAEPHRPQPGVAVGNPVRQR